MTTFSRLGYDADATAVARSIDLLMEEAQQDAQPVLGAREMIEDLHALGFHLGVISSAIYHPFLLRTLEAFEIAHCFDFVVTSASCGYYKSSPLIYEHALALGQTAAVSATHVGDSLRWDVTTASQVGMRTVYLESTPADTMASAIPLATPDLTIGSFIGSRDAIVRLAMREIPV